MSKEIKYSGEGRQLILSGVNKLANAVKATLGPRGRNVIIERAFGNPLITKDGVTVAKEIDLKDRFENMGAQMVRAVASKTNDDAGDGTTTATVLAQAIYQEGLSQISGGADPMMVKDQIDYAVSEVLTALKANVLKVDTREVLEQVATISANNDATLGKVIASVIDKIGPEGVCSVENGNTAETHVTFVDGMKMDRGFLSPYFATNPDKMICEMIDPNILVYNKKITNMKAFVPILEKAAGSGKPLLIIAEDVDNDILGTLVLNKVKNNFQVCAIRHPGFGTNRIPMTEDLAASVGAVVLDEAAVRPLDKAELADLGGASKVIITRDQTTIIGAKGDTKSRVDSLRSLMQATTDVFEKDRYKERLAKLSGGVAILYIGGSTEIEMREKRDRVEDALNATKAAVEEGIVAGGGTALLRAGQATQNVLVRNACEAPFRQISANAGSTNPPVGAILESDNVNYGYDARSGKFTDMIEAGIIDPVKVTRNALQNAASIAGLLLTTEALIVNLEDKK